MPSEKALYQWIAAARIEGLCGQLTKRILVSESFASQFSKNERSLVDPLRLFDLKGIREKQSIFALTGLP
ncbi:MAG: hypothetical protein HQM14_17435 [SAR324 cluster bacterium]|nr:hypothetical protein [SAR324 cluster bacterium]